MNQLQWENLQLLIKTDIQSHFANLLLIADVVITDICRLYIK